MLYSYDLVLPANTAPAAPAHYDLKLTHGVVTRVEVQFPPGCAGLAHVYARRALYQVWPTNPDADLSADGYVIAWNEYYELFADPMFLTLFGYNLDDTYPHTVTWRIELTPRDVAERLKSNQSLISRIGQLLGVKG